MQQTSPRCFLVQEAQSTLLLKKEQDMRIVDDALEYMKQEYRTRVEVCAHDSIISCVAPQACRFTPCNPALYVQEVNKKEQQLEVDKREMQAMVERFKDFIQDNDAKRSRAHMKQSAEEDASGKLQGELMSLQEQHDTLQEQREALETELSRLERYAAYMDSVVAQRHEEYAETSSIHQRWRTLATFHSKHQASVTATQTAADAQRQQVQELRRETEDKILALSSQVQEHTEHLGAVRASLADLQESVESAAAVRGEAAKESKMVMTSIRNMYQRCKAKAPKSYPTVRLSPLPQHGELAECLGVICQRLLDLQCMMRDYPAWRVAQEAAAAARAEEKRRQAEDSALPLAAQRAAGAAAATHGRRAGKAGSTARSSSSMLGGGPSAVSGRGAHIASSASLLSASSPKRRGATGSTAKLPVGMSAASLPPGTAIATSQPGVFAIRLGGAGHLSPSGPAGGSPAAGGSSGFGSTTHLTSSAML